MISKKIEDILLSPPESLRLYSTGLLQGTAYNLLHTHLSKTLSPFNLSIPEWKLLGQLNEHGEMKLTELAEYMNYAPPMVTKLAKLLEKKSLAQRDQDKYDERAKIIKITGKGSRILDEIEPEVRKAVGAAFQGSTADELKIYLKILGTIVSNLR